MNAIRELLEVLRQRLGDAPSDGALLEAYVQQRDDAALAALVERHSGMVWGVCRRLLRNEADAEDAFQAAFLVLVRNAASIRQPEKLAGWLHSVARQTALRMQAVRARLGRHEVQVALLPEKPDSPQQLWSDLKPILDRELNRLPDKYRTVIVLCDLEEKTRTEAARQLGCPEGTVAGRLAGARALLADRLTRCGVTASAVSLAAALAARPASAAPLPLIAAIVQSAATGAMSPTVANLANGVIKTMMLGKFKTTAALLLAAILPVVMTGLFVYAVASQRPAEPNAPHAEARQPAAEPHKPLAVQAVPGPKEAAGKAAPPSGQPAPALKEKLPRHALKRLGSARWQFSCPENPAAYSSDGKALISYDGQSNNVRVRTLDVATGDEIRSFPTYYFDFRSGVVARDRKTIVLSDYDKILLWDMTSGQQIRTFPGYIGSSACMSADGKILAGVGGYEGRYQPFPPTPHETLGCLWNTATGSPLQPFGKGIKGAVCLDVDPAGTAIAWRGKNGDVHVVDRDGAESWQIKAPLAAERKNEDRPLDPPQFRAVAFSPDGKQLAFGTQGGLMLVDAATGKNEVACKYKVPSRDAVARILFTPAGDRVVAYCADPAAPSIAIWDVAGGEEKARFPAQSMAFTVSPDGKTLALANDQSIDFYDTATGKRLPEPERLGAIRRGTLSADGKLAAIASDFKIRIWDLQTEKVKTTISSAGPGLSVLPDGLAFTPDSKRLIGVWGKPLVWDVETGTQEKRNLVDGNGAGGNCAAVSADGNLVAAGYSYDGNINLWDLRNNSHVYLKGCKGHGNSACFSGDGKRLAVGSGDRLGGKDIMDRAVYVFDVAERKLISRTSSNSQYVTAVAISPDGKLVCSCSEGTPVFDADTGKELHRLGVDPVAQLAFSPDGKTLAVSIGSWHGRPTTQSDIILVDVKTMKGFQVLAGHTRRISSISFSADSQLLLSTSLDGTALLWGLGSVERKLEN